MSGAAFEGLWLTPERQQEAYTPAGPGHDEGLLAQLLSLYTERTLHEIAFQGAHGYHDTVEQRKKRVGDILEPHLDGGFDGNALLDALMARIANEDVDEHTSLLLDPLVQCLYDAGCNDFHLNLDSFHTLPLQIAYRLKGTRERPLRATYSGTVGDTLAEGAHHCMIGFTGSSEYVGNHAEYSLFTMWGDVEMLKSAKGCIFHFPDRDEISAERYYFSLHGCSIYFGNLPLPETLGEKRVSIRRSLAEEWSDWPILDTCYVAEKGRWRNARSGEVGR